MNSCRHCTGDVDDNGECYSHCSGSVIVRILEEEDGFPARFLMELHDIQKVLSEISGHLDFIADEYRKHGP